MIHEPRVANECAPWPYIPMQKRVAEFFAGIGLKDIEHPLQPNEIDRAIERLNREGKWPE